jgi:hypothetical protein
MLKGIAALAALACVGLSVPAEADKIVQSSSASTYDDSKSPPDKIKQFDPSLGHLDSIDIDAFANYTLKDLTIYPTALALASSTDPFGTVTWRADGTGGVSVGGINFGFALTEAAEHQKTFEFTTKILSSVSGGGDGSWSDDASVVPFIGTGYLMPGLGSDASYSTLTFDPTGWFQWQDYDSQYASSASFTITYNYTPGTPDTRRLPDPPVTDPSAGSVPEPASWMTMLIGLVVLGGAVRRQSFSSGGGEMIANRSAGSTLKAV